MPPRGNIVEAPQWWLDALQAEIAARALSRTDLAEFLLPKSATGTERSRLLNAARVKVTRFLDGVSGTPPIRTMELVEVFCDRLGIPPFAFSATGHRRRWAADRRRDRAEQRRVRALLSRALTFDVKTC